MMGNWQELKPSIVFGCDDIDKTYGVMLSNGVEFLEEPQKETWGNFVRFKDIDGNVFL